MKNIVRIIIVVTCLSLVTVGCSSSSKVPSAASKPVQIDLSNSNNILSRLDTLSNSGIITEEQAGIVSGFLAKKVKQNGKTFNRQQAFGELVKYGVITQDEAKKIEDVLFENQSN